MSRDPYATEIRRRPDGSIDTATHARDGLRQRSRWWRALMRRLAAGARPWPTLGGRGTAPRAEPPPVGVLR